MTEKKKRGRPMSSHDVSVTPEFRETPDIEKLGRVLLSVATSLTGADGRPCAKGHFCKKSFSPKKEGGCHDIAIYGFISPI